MNEPLNDFYDTRDLEAIDREIEEQLNKPKLLDRLQERSDEQTARKMSWANEIKQFWPIYLFLAVSAVFTTMLGIYLGLAPALVTDPATGNQMIHFNTDWGHVFTAIVDVIAFLAVTEFAFAVAKIKFHQREPGNFNQVWTMIMAMVVAFVSIIGTGISGGTVVASTLGFLSEFAEIPPSVQKWVVWIIPILLGLYAVLYAVYELSSRNAKARRLARQNKLEQELDFQVRMDNIEILARRQLQLAEIKAYERAVLSGKLTAGEAEAARRAGKTLNQLEKERGEDLDGDNTVAGKPVKAAARKSLPPVPAVQREYTTQELCDLWHMAREQAAAVLGEYPSSGEAYQDCRANGYLPEDMSRGNFAAIFRDLMQDFPQPFRIPSPVNRDNGAADPTKRQRPYDI